MGKGRLLVLDGPDGAGKTTQTRLLIDRLRSSGFAVEHLRDPGGTDLGEQIRILLLDPLREISARAEALLFLASRAQLVEEKIRPALAAGKIVVCERFHSSTVAYQGFAGGLGAEPIENACQFSAGGLLPDLTMILDIDPDGALKRIQGKLDRLEMRGSDYHEQVRLGFMQYAMAHPGAVVVVDAHGSELEVHERIWSAAAGVL